MSALPIVGLLSFLIGVVVAYQGADQLGQFGVEVFTVNLLGVGILRELGGLMAAMRNFVATLQLLARAAVRQPFGPPELGPVRRCSSPALLPATYGQPGAWRFSPQPRSR